MSPVETADMGSMEAQLNDLYKDREYLERELGLSDAQEVVAMVRSLEAQLVDLYREKEEAGK